MAANNGITNTLVDVTDLKILEDAISDNTKVRMVTIIMDVMKIELFVIWWKGVEQLFV